MSHELQASGIDHVVLERGRVGQSWRDRWDSFCLVTPNWYVQLPGGATRETTRTASCPRRGRRPPGALRSGFGAPVLDHIDVTALRSGPTAVRAGHLRRPDAHQRGRGRDRRVPEAASPTRRALPANILAIDATAYTQPDALPPGGVLVVGSGQTGCQIADELHRSGREVTLACGKAAWAPRRIEERDIVCWLLETPFLEQSLDDLPSPLARLAANFQTSGRNGGQDLNYGRCSPTAYA